MQNLHVPREKHKIVTMKGHMNLVSMYKSLEEKLTILIQRFDERLGDQYACNYANQTPNYKPMDASPPHANTVTIATPQVLIENNYSIIVERANESKWIFLVLNSYYESLRELKGSFVAWLSHLVQLDPNLVRFTFNFLKYTY